MEKNFWEKNYEAFCEESIPQEQREQIIDRAWTFALSATLIVVGLLAYLNF